jgi:hypothetical protein
MMSPVENSNSDIVQGHDAIELMDVIDFLIRWWKFIVAMGVLTGIGAAIYASTLPTLFQAQALLMVAESPEVMIKINDARQHGTLTRPSRDIESPEVLQERLKVPTAYPAGVVASCKFSSQAELLDHLTGFHADTGKATFRFTVLHKSPEWAAQCAEAVFQMIRAQQAELAKANFDSLNASAVRVQILLLGSQARLLAPVYASEVPVQSKKGRVMGAGIAAGIFFGLSSALVWTLAQSYRRVSVKRNMNSDSTTTPT